MTATAAEPSPRRFSLFHLILVVPWIAIVIDAFKPITDNSFLWHIRAGELQATSASVLTTDPFSFTMHGEHWLTQSWLAELAYYWGGEAFEDEVKPVLEAFLAGKPLEGESTPAVAPENAQ